MGDGLYLHKNKDNSLLLEKRNLHGSTHPASLMNVDKALDIFEGENALGFERLELDHTIQVTSKNEIV